MGVGLNSALALVGTAGVGASKLSTAISEANDAAKATAAKERAKKNKEAAIKNKKEQKVQQKQILKKKEDETKSVLQGSNTDPKTRVNVMQELRER